MQLTLQVSIPVDDTGFLRRQCAHCRAEFKVPATDDREIRACPHCGEGGDDWLTAAQNAFLSAHAQAAVLPHVEDLIGEMLDSAFRGSKNVTVRHGPRRARSTPSPMPGEPNDMVIHTMAGCGDQVKMPEGTSPRCCWACGETA